MAPPVPAVQQNGLGSVSDDNLNTFVQACLNYAQMRTFPGVPTMAVLALGTYAPNDGGQGHFYWNATSTSPDNNSTIIVPTGYTVGAWERLTGV
jgi:hypothetical protein